MALIIMTETRINASTQKVWEFLTDFKAYPNWNPFIKSISHQVEVGKEITVHIEAPDSKGMTFKPKVLTFIKSKEFSWIGHLLFPGIFDGKHKFELIDNGDKTTTFRQSEIFKGILVPFFKKQLNINTRNGFIAMNQKLKMIIESKN